MAKLGGSTSGEKVRILQAEFCSCPTVVEWTGFVNQRGNPNVGSNPTGSLES